MGDWDLDIQGISWEIDIHMIGILVPRDSSNIELDSEVMSFQGIIYGYSLDML